jgi:hypothetical protein
MLNTPTENILPLLRMNHASVIVKENMYIVFGL